MMIHDNAMKERSAEKSEVPEGKHQSVVPQPPAEAIYDLTTSDETELIKAAGPRERGEE